jgi:hypothetical protein
MGGVKDFGKVDVFPTDEVEPFSGRERRTSGSGQNVLDNGLWVKGKIVKLLVGFSDILW